MPTGLGACSLGVYRLGIYNLRLPILDLGSLPILDLGIRSLEPAIWESRIWESTISGRILYLGTHYFSTVSRATNFKSGDPHTELGAYGLRVW